jgi:hypothetical protein
MPSDQHDSDYAQSSASGSQHEYVDDCGRLMRGTEEIAIMEPSPHKITYGEEFKGFLKEKWGRLVHDDQLMKEGIAIEKGAHPRDDRARASQNLDRFLATYQLDSARAREGVMRRHTQ